MFGTKETLRRGLISGVWSSWVDITNLVNSTDYTSKITTNSTTVKNLWSTNIKKVGCNVNFIVNTTVNAYSNKTVKLGTLPSEVCPTQSICVNTLSNSGKNCYVYIDPNGSFGYTKISETSWEDGDGVRACISYITNN